MMTCVGHPFDAVRAVAESTISSSTRQHECTQMRYTMHALAGSWSVISGERGPYVRVSCALRAKESRQTHGPRLGNLPPPVLATWPLAVRFCAAHPSGLD
eukprot:scaffold19712_cov75-Phaeocystis_antarctica.AAC.2